MIPLPNWPHCRFPAMGSHVQMWLDADGPTEHLFNEAQSIVAWAESLLSRFQPSSDVSRINACAGRWVTVSDLAYDVISRAVEYVRLTGGRFDPTFGAGHTIRLDSTFQRVKIAPGTRLDLGGIAKGYIADLAAQYLGAYGPSLIDASGDLVAVGAPTAFEGWPVGIQAPYDGETIATLFLKDQSLATSGVDRHTHHIIDPFVGTSLTPEFVTASVISNDAIQAEVLATTALLNPEFVKEHFDVGLLLIDTHNTISLNPAMNLALYQKGF